MKTKYFAILISLTTILLYSSACQKPLGINGNNQATTETRQMVSFDRIANDGPFNVYITQDSIYQVIVEAESNLIPYIRTIVNGNTLVIETRENLNNHNPINVYVKTPTVLGVYLNGSGIMNIDSLNTGNIQIELSGSGNIGGIVNANAIYAKINGSGNIFINAICSSIETQISGSGNIELTGNTVTGNHNISGSGNINAYNFIHKDCVSKISGSGNMYLNVTDHLDVSISGSGSVFYIGNPQLNVNITGSGSVHKQ